jgi:hypothetical protein
LPEGRTVQPLLVVKVGRPATVSHALGQPALHLTDLGTLLLDARMGQLGSVPAFGLVVLGPARIGRTRHRVHPRVIAIPDTETRPALMPTRPLVEALDASTRMRLLMALIPSNDDDPRPRPARSARAFNLSRCGA